MHINYRRKNKHRAKHHNCWAAWYMIYSMKPMKRASWRLRRSQARDHMAHGRYDMLPNRYPRDIIWNYW